MSERPDAREVEHLGRQIAALAPRLRGIMIEHAVRHCRARLDACRVHEHLREDTLRTLIRDIRLSIEQHAPGAHIGPCSGT